MGGSARDRQQYEMLPFDESGHLGLHVRADSHDRRSALLQSLRDYFGHPAFLTVFLSGSALPYSTVLLGPIHHSSSRFRLQLILCGHSTDRQHYSRAERDLDSTKGDKHGWSREEWPVVSILANCVSSSWRCLVSGGWG